MTAGAQGEEEVLNRGPYISKYNWFSRKFEEKKAPTVIFF